MMNKLIVEQLKQQPAKPNETAEIESGTAKTVDSQYTTEAMEAKLEETNATVAEVQPEAKPDPVNFALLNPETRAALEKEIRELFQESSLLDG